MREFIDVMLGRVSIPAASLSEPAPRADDLELILKAAVSAPDHGLLRPWRFIVIQGTARQSLGTVFAAALKADRPDIDEIELETARKKPLRAPMIIVVVAVLQKDHKIPVREQLFSAAAAAQNVLLAASALAYGAIWVTGRVATHPLVLKALGLADNEEIIGLINIGTAEAKVLAARQKNAKRPVLSHYVSEWKGL